jgi:hypothetical protein
MMVGIIQLDRNSDFIPLAQSLARRPPFASSQRQARGASHLKKIASYHDLSALLERSIFSP